MLCTRFPLFIMKTLTCYCHKHKRTHLIQPALNSPPINFGWVSWLEQKHQESSRCWDWVWIEALSHWMTLRTVSWPPCASPTRQYHWGKGGSSLKARCSAQAFQAKLQNSKISKLIRKHFPNDSPVPFDFFLKGWEWPGSRWGTRMISFVLAGWAPLTAYLQNVWVGLPENPDCP